MKKKSYILALGLIVVALICSRTCGRDREEVADTDAGGHQPLCPPISAT